MWMEWWAIDGERVALYIWNNLPDPLVQESVMDSLTQPIYATEWALGL